MLALILAVAFGPLLWPVQINDIDFSAQLQGPGWTHPLGTDDLGQDLLARMLYGGRISISVGLAAMAVSVIVGTIVGAIAGVSRGSIDAALVWLIDLFLSLPQVPVLLVIIYLYRGALTALLGPELGIFVLIVAGIGAFRWMTVARLVRAQLFALREKEFVEAARALGASTFRLVVRHVLPNALGPVIVAGTIDVANAIIAESDAVVPGVGVSAGYSDLGAYPIRRQGLSGRGAALGADRGRGDFSRGAGDQLHRRRAARCAGPAPDHVMGQSAAGFAVIHLSRAAGEVGAKRRVRVVPHASPSPGALRAPTSPAVRERCTGGARHG